MAYDGNKAVNGNGLLYFWTQVKAWIRNTFQAKITGGASTITDDNLTGSRALVSNSSGKVAVSAVTSTELGYLDGVTSNVQTQLGNKMSNSVYIDNSSQTMTNLQLHGVDEITLEFNGSSGINIGLDPATSSSVGGFVADAVKTGSAVSDGLSGLVYVNGNSGDDYGKLLIKPATSTTGGVLSDAMAVKLNGIEAGANNYTLPEATTTALGGIQLVNDARTTTLTYMSVNVDGYNFPVQLASDGKAFVEIPEMSVNSLGLAYVGTGLFVEEHHLSVDTSTIATREYADSAYTLPTATTAALGGFKAAYVRTSTISMSNGGTTGIYTGVEVNSQGVAFTNVPLGTASALGVTKLYTSANASKEDGTYTAKFISSTFAPKASPTFTGSPKAPTATTGTSSTQIATTAFVQQEITANAYSYYSEGDSTATIEIGSSSIAFSSSDGGTLIIDASNISIVGDNDELIGIHSGNLTYNGNEVATLVSPTFTGVPAAPTATAGTNNTQIATTAFVNTAVSSAIAGATQFQGTIAAESTLKALTSFTAGQYWLITAAGTYAGQACESGDQIYCITTHTHTADADLTNANFSVIQGNVDFLTNAEIQEIFDAVA